MPATKTLHERFLDKISPEPNTGCWLWTACLNHKGYAQISGIDRKILRAHRYAYEYYKGPIPEGLQIDHLCRVRCCVNPDHLEPVTAYVNTHRGTTNVLWDAHRNITHCPQGHPYDEENTMYFRNGKNGQWQQRQCRECQRKRSREWMQRARDRKKAALAALEPAAA